MLATEVASPRPFGTGELSSHDMNIHFWNAWLSLIFLCLGASASAAESITLGGAGKPPAVVTTSRELIAAGARDRLVQRLRELTGAEPATPAAVEGAGDVAIVLGDAALAKKYGAPAPEASREESFVIAPAKADGKTLLVVSGQTDRGIKQGVYHLLRNVRIDAGGKLVLPDAPVRSSPEIKLRVSHIGGSMGPEKSKRGGERLDWNMIARWDPQRIGDYTDMLDFFGYNGIEEPPTFYDPKDQSEAMLARRKALREHLLHNGQVGIAKIDGTLLGPGLYTTNTPWTPQTKEQYTQYYRGMAQTAATFNDIVLTHWVDLGGWPHTPAHPCTIEMLEDLHNEVTDEFRRVNPNIKSILNLWNMQNRDYDRWKGYQPRGVDVLIASRKISKDTGFTQSRIYRPEEAQKILAAGHPLGIWGWYTADNEITFTMHVHTHLLKAAMNALPPDAGEKVWFYSMDNCQREFNIYSVYVAARLLWDPKSDPEAHLREISRLVYGPQLEEPIFRALKAIADVRCGTSCRSYFFAGKDGTNGVVDLEQGLRQANEAWARLKDLQIDKTYIPPIKFHRSSDVLLEELKGQMQAMAAYVQFLKDEQAGSASPTEVPASPGPFEYTERTQYLKHLAAKKSTTSPAK
jgi:hypothetical protein